MHRCLNRVVWALVALLGGLSACLNPDISDEDPLTTQAAALDVDDGGAPSDDSAEAEAEAEARLDDAELEQDSAGRNAAAPDVSGSDSKDRSRPRRSSTRR